jgi:hypothetical protein
MSPSDFREQIVDPALNAIGLWSESAAQLLVGTAIQESRLRNINQIGGPAKGYFQIEPATYYDLWDRYLNSRPDLADRVRSLCAPAPPSVAELVGSPRFACALARIKYLRVPEPLPPAGDVAAMGAYWKQFYNSPSGRGTAEEFVANWNAAHAAQAPLSPIPGETNA